MQEIHIILLYDRELASVLKHIVVFKASLDTDEKLSLHRSELRAEAYTEAAVLVTVQTVFVDYTAVPVITFPELTLARFPVIANLAIDLHGVAVGERPLVAHGGVES